MVACYAKVSALSRTELEATAAGKVDCEECEVQAAQLILAYQDRVEAWRESCAGADTGERLRRYRAAEAAKARLEETPAIVTERQKWLAFDEEQAEAGEERGCDQHRETA